VDRRDPARALTRLGRPLAGAALMALLGNLPPATAAPRALPTGGAQAAAAARRSAGESTFAFPPFGTIHVYAPPFPPQQVVVFLSGDGGWNLGVVPMARRLAAEGALVAGVDVRRVFASLSGASPCAYPAGGLEELSRAVQLRQRLPRYHRPVLVGYSSGATLAYAAVAQAPVETFRGALSLGFCPDVPLATPLCRGRGLTSRPLAKGLGRDLDPFPGLAVPWTVLHGDIDQVCAADAASAFVSRTGSGRIVRLPKVGHGFSVTSRWEPQYVDAFRAIASASPDAPARGATAPAPASPATDGAVAAAASPVAADPGRSALADLGLVETLATGPPARPGLADAFAVILTGDGGWAGVDKAIAARLAGEGVPSVGWSSLEYYWTPRTPEAAAADLARAIEEYARRWRRPRVLVVGYSFGADVLPFLVTRLPPAVRSRVALAALVGLSPRASFEFHVAGWLGVDEGGEHATVPEAERLAPTPVVCVRGDGESDSACGALAGTARVVTLPGGHHLGGDYARLVDELLSGWR
jgi:type IV secretory pathway VirJ component